MIQFYVHARPVVAEDLPYTYTPQCPVSPSELVRLEFNHFNFSSLLEEGALVLHESVADKLRSILRVFFDERFPIHTAVPIDSPRFKGDDELSMAANNSSAFNFRQIAGTDRPSNHSFGTAIDINPVQNPYQYIDGHWGPLVEGHDYTDRTTRRPGMFFRDLPVVEAFLTEGFEWGGLWERPDFHHFELAG